MRLTFSRCVLAGAATLVAAAPRASHAGVLPNVYNQEFLDYTGAAPPDCFDCVDLTNWTGGNGLIYVDAPGTAATSPNTIDVYPGFPANSPAGGNFVEADANPTYASGFQQTITGLTAGVTYTLGFYQAAGQEQGFADGTPTSERWIVSLGTSALSVSQTGGPTDPMYGPTGEYSDADPGASIAASADMITPSGGNTPWQYVSVQLTADATTDLLSFLAWGDNGGTINLQPIVFLSGVNAADIIPTPEPATLAVLAVGLAGVGVARSRRRRR